MRLVEQASLTKKKNSKPLINTRMGLAPDKQVGVKPGHVPSLSVKTLESVKKWKKTNDPTLYKSVSHL